MAALGVYNPTLLDIAKATDPDGKIATIVEILNETNEILDDMTWMEGNLPTGHRTSIRSGLPAPTWRKLYGGVQPSKATQVQVTDNCGMLEAYAEIDKALADLNGNSAAWRLSEERAFIEGFNQKLSRYMFLGNEATEPEGFTGLAPRFNSLSAQNADNIIDAFSGSGGDLTSIWLCVWGPQTGFGIYPKGSMGGLQMHDKGQVTVENATDYSGGAVGGGRFEAYRTHYRWDAGLTIRDWRYFVRIPNIDVSDLTKNASAGADLLDLMAQALEVVLNALAESPHRTELRQLLPMVVDTNATAYRQRLGERAVGERLVALVTLRQLEAPRAPVRGLAQFHIHGRLALDDVANEAAVMGRFHRLRCDGSRASIAAIR